jgi:peroxiredoxin
MKAMLRLFLTALPLLAAQAPASPAETSRLMKSWESAMEGWSREMLAATTPEMHAATLAKRPDPLPQAPRMWQLIGNHLDQEWVIEPAAWFLRLTPGLMTARPDGSSGPAFADESRAILQAVETHHLRSPGLTPMCMALLASGNPQALSILDRIQTSNPDPKIQGVAALATAMALKSLGEDPEIMRKRLTCLRNAIINSSDVDLGGITVAKLAEDELYIIRHLSKGRVAPDLHGVDAANRPLKLSGEAGRVVMVLFWNSTMDEAERVIRITNEARRRFEGRPFTVLGVNLDPLEKLRLLEAEGTVTWRNFSDPGNRLTKDYRVKSLPLVYVLDGERRIHYAGAPGSFADLTIEALLSDAVSETE